MRIETTLTATEPEAVIQPARSHSSKICGQPGEYIIAPPQFFLDANGETVAKYGDKGKLWEAIVNLLGLRKFIVLRFSVSMVSKHEVTS